MSNVDILHQKQPLNRFKILKVDSPENSCEEVNDINESVVIADTVFNDKPQERRTVDSIPQNPSILVQS